MCPLLTDEEYAEFEATFNCGLPVESNKVKFIYDGLDEISREFEKASIPKENIPIVGTRNIGMFSVRTANETIRQASLEKDPEPLFDVLWYEGEVACLFADSNVGKSIFAVQMAEHISHSQRVLYFDFELSDKQFQQRYTDETTGELYAFSDNFLRTTINTSNIDSRCFEDQIILDIEQSARETGAKVLIIDNLSYLSSNSEKGDCASELMMRLLRLKRDYGYSILVLAHTPKRAMDEPITQNHLAGSKRLFNFFDSAFSIGKSAQDDNLRYIKQVKVRTGGFTYDNQSFMISEIDKHDSLLKFVFRLDENGNTITEFERSHLREPDPNGRASKIEEVKKLRDEGLTHRQIAEQTGLSRSAVGRMLT